MGWRRGRRRRRYKLIRLERVHSISIYFFNEVGISERATSFRRRDYDSRVLLRGTATSYSQGSSHTLVHLRKLIAHPIEENNPPSIPHTPSLTRQSFTRQIWKKTPTTPEHRIPSTRTSFFLLPLLTSPFPHPSILFPKHCSTIPPSSQPVLPQLRIYHPPPTLHTIPPTLSHLKHKHKHKVDEHLLLSS